MTEEEFDELRPSAFAIAYRMLGSVSNSRPASSQPPRTVISKGWKNRWPTTSLSPATGGGKAPPRQTCVPRPPQCGAHAEGGAARRRSLRRLRAAPRGSQRATGALVLDRAGRLIAVLILVIADGQIQAVRAGGARETFGADVVITGPVEVQ